MTDFAHEIRDAILQEAVIDDDVPIARKLLENGADPDVRDHDKQFFLLHHAYGNNSIKMLTLLIDHGANMRAVTKHGFTVLRSAANDKNVNVIRLFLQSGADPNYIQNKGDKTALDLYAIGNSAPDMSIVALFLQCGALATITESARLVAKHIQLLESRVVALEEEVRKILKRFE